MCYFLYFMVRQFTMLMIIFFLRFLSWHIWRWRFEQMNGAWFLFSSVVRQKLLRFVLTFQVCASEFIVPDSHCLSVQQCWFEITEEQFEWIEREYVPLCLLQHVKHLEFKGVDDDEEELWLLEYMLKFTTVLEMLTIRLKGSISEGSRRKLR